MESYYTVFPVQYLIKTEKLGLINGKLQMRTVRLRGALSRVRGLPPPHPAQPCSSLPLSAHMNTKTGWSRGP
jgi:hypothetical protein